MPLPKEAVVSFDSGLVGAKNGSGLSKFPCLVKPPAAFWEHITQELDSDREVHATTLTSV